MRFIATKATWRLSARGTSSKCSSATTRFRTLTPIPPARFTPKPAGNTTERLTIPLLTRNTLQGLAATTSTTLPAPSRRSWCPSMNFIVPAIERRAGTVLFAYDLTSYWDLLASYSREHESGTRPLGLIFNSSPSASLTGGYGAEVPEPIDYFNNTVKVRAEYARKKLGIQIGYTGSFFQNDTSALFFDNPFRTSDCVAPNGCTNATQGPATGQVDLYPGQPGALHQFRRFVLVDEASAPAGQHQRRLAAAERSLLCPTRPIRYCWRGPALCRLRVCTEKSRRWQ